MVTPMSRHLTKSRFKLALECPTKLFYTKKRDVYPDKQTEDSFLAALAEGGHQVGELATLYFPGGVMIHTLDEEAALAETNALLAQEDATIYEAAVLYGNLFVRVDVLVKCGDDVRLIEVKAKSCDSGGAEQFLAKRGGVKASWKPYLMDVTFQKYVLQHALPASHVSAYLMLIDKAVPCPTNGLHQKFLLVKDEDGRPHVELTSDLSDLEFNNPILRAIHVDDIANDILESSDYGPNGDMSFGEMVEVFSSHYEGDRRISVPIGDYCKECTFHTNANEKAAGKRSGFEECWTAAPEWNEASFDVPTVLDIGQNCRKAGKLIAEGRASIMQVTADDLNYDQRPDPKMTGRERQWLRVKSVQRKDPTMHLRRDELRAEMATWVYPLHFIDFETASPAIPFHEGLHAYEPLAFQFSHHLVHKDGRVEHKGEYIDARLDAFPNFDFVRELKRELETDQGTIFRYAAHENTILAHIRKQLRNSDRLPQDAGELVEFIETITQATNPKAGDPEWRTPKRNMVDMLELVRSYYFDPAMGASNSIKKVLPAVLSSSEYVRDKYSRPIYGTPELPSLNFKDMVWVELDASGKPRDPYQLLPLLFDDVPPEELSNLVCGDDELRDGGAAMTAYARMQFTEMSETEHSALRKALLKYCELDTLAMVMIFEAWREWLQPPIENPKG